MTLLLDLGNTRLKLALLAEDGATSRGIASMQAVTHSGVADFADALDRAFDALPATIDSCVDSAWLASAHHGAALDVLLHALSTRGFDVHRVEQAADRADLRLAYRQPAQFGVDRWLGMLGARSICAESLLLVMVGTAITVDLLSADGEHLGGLITPSPPVMVDGLRHRAAHLPLVDFEATHDDTMLFASDTAMALRNGCVAAALGLVGMALETAAARLGQRPTLMFSGGGATALLSAWNRQSNGESPPVLIEQAVLTGLARLASEHNI